MRGDHLSSDRKQRYFSLLPSFLSRLYVSLIRLVC